MLVKPIKELLSAYKSMYAASKELGISAVQLSRWASNNAMVDDEGGIWIKTKGQFKMSAICHFKSWPTEDRIDVIGTNGNEGDHYDN
jgi:hypothetical protein